MSTRHIRLLLALAVLFFVGPVFGALDTSNPTAFFTNIASRLLKADLNMDLNRIQVYPTNQYTPAAHRLLQVTANLYDSTTNRAETGYPFLPSVFRPLFRRDTNGIVWISGYREVTNAVLATDSTPLDLEESGGLNQIPIDGTTFDPSDLNEPMVVGVPLIIGAKKGYPAFNKFAMENAITVRRDLLFRRTVSGQPVTITNQLYSLVISNSFGIQAWNSYTNPFPRQLTISAVANITVAMTNEFGVIQSQNGAISNRFSAAAFTNIAADSWPGHAYPNVQAFVLPIKLVTNFPNCPSYAQNGTSAGTYFAYSRIFDPDNTFRVPKWNLLLRTKMRFVLLDISFNRIVDWVSLKETEEPIDLISTAASTNSYSTDVGDSNPGIFWISNRVGIPEGGPVPDNVNIPTYGVMNQFKISIGATQVSDWFWHMFNAVSSDKNTAIQQFVNNLFLTRTNLNFTAPFSPIRRFYHYTRWEANDPFVHQLTDDLVDQFANTDRIQWDTNTRSPITRLSSNPLSEHYRPWGGNPNNPAETSYPTRFNPAVKDPLLFRSDDWNFPGGEPLTFETLGRIHRGTPWQTVYLKSELPSPMGLNTWRYWTGHTNVSDAVATFPTNDWHLVSVLDSLLNLDPHQRLSINSTSTNQWLQALDGISVITNSQPDSEILISSDSPQASAVAQGIAHTRTTLSRGSYSTLGEILAVPELTFASPWMNTNQLSSYFAPSDIVLEKLPGKLLSKLRADSVGAITRSNGWPILSFSGYDGFSYRIDGSCNLIDWAPIQTNTPVGGLFEMITPLQGEAGFYRSMLLP